MSNETYVVHVTRQCNMNCLYCYEDDKTSVFTWEEIEKYLTNMLKYAPENFMIEFLGGEPMLEFDHIKKTVEFVGERCQDYVITTNGTILEEEHINWLLEHPYVRFAISVDGPAAANMFRITKENKSSWPICVENIKKLHRVGLEPSIHIVSHPYNVGYLYDSVKAMYDLGIRHIGMGTVEKTIRIDQRYADEFVHQMDQISTAIIDSTLEGLYIDLLTSVKPESDVRTYIRDESGKVIGETYGRAKGDISDQEFYAVQKCEETNEVGQMILNIRRTVYENHQKALRSSMEK